ncbi:MAG: dihydroxyacetone kinase operon transcriptional regulator DhaR [Ardenticatenaceae bacterium]|nr:dihydroxyacetone kinase operon transcriptional regulator DhaR [Ardenticatenaceae bacterium]
MRPTDYPLNLAELKRQWQIFFSDGEAEQPQIDPVILASWRRCLPLFDPDGQPRPSTIRPSMLPTLINAQSELASVAMPHLEDTYQSTEGSNSVILLTDGSGCLLYTAGDAEALEQLERHSLTVGTYLAESQVGTNAIGLAMVNAMPLQVVGPEHYFRKHHFFATSAAPVYGANGRIIGIIGLIGFAEDASSHDLALIMSTARAISNQISANFYLEQANDQIHQMRTLLETIHDGVLAWDEKGVITQLNGQAADMLSLEPKTFLGELLRDVITLPPVVVNAIIEQYELVDVETKIQVGDKEVNCWVSLRPLQHRGGALQGYIAILRPAQAVRRLVNQQISTSTGFHLSEMDSQSTTMRASIRQGYLAAKGNAPVLLVGESGVGKNPFARAIHNASSRAHQPFISINCGAIPHELMVEELLGFEHAANGYSRPSKFELADEGTLLLNQINELSREMQMALLEIFEAHHVMRIGGSNPIPVNVRIIATTSTALDPLVTKAHFLPELYYRFGIFKILIPPLRERLEDIPYLCERFLSRASQRTTRPLWVDDQVLTVLKRYPWPGNIRELEDVLERAISQTRDGVIRLVDLPDHIRQGRALNPDDPLPRPILTAAEAEREAILNAGWACQGNVTQMAEHLQIGRTTLWRKMKRLNLTPQNFRLD